MPYVMNHGGLGPITSQDLIDRRNEITSLYCPGGRERGEKVCAVPGKEKESCSLHFV